MTFALLFISCTPQEIDSLAQVVTSFYPLTYFTEQIAGDYVNITQITPDGIEPHEYALSTNDLKAIETADLTVAQGGAFENWAEEFYFGQLVDYSGLVLVYSHEMDFVLNEENLLDPHVWLDPVLAQEMVLLLSDYLSELDPEHAPEFRTNAEAIRAKLAALDEEISAGLSSCQTNKLIVTHDAFSYFSSRYNLETLPLLNAADFDEPSLQELKDLADYAKENGLAVIYMESLENPEVAKVLAEEANLTTLVLNTLEGLTPEEKLAGEDYFSIMRSNLTNLKTGLMCQ